MTRKTDTAAQPEILLSHRVEASATAPKALTGARLKADQTTIAIEATKDGKLRCRANPWPEPLIVLAGRQLVIRNIAGQVNVFDVPAE